MPKCVSNFIRLQIFAGGIILENEREREQIDARRLDNDENDVMAVVATHLRILLRSLSTDIYHESATRIMYNNIDSCIVIITTRIKSANFETISLIVGIVKPSIPLSGYSSNLAGHRSENQPNLMKLILGRPLDGRETELTWIAP